MDFKILKLAVAKQFEQMHRSHKLFRTGSVPQLKADGTPVMALDELRASERQALWDTYLGAFKEGTNPIHVKETEHNCSCCRNFIRSIGNVVAIVDNKLVSIWDVKVSEPGYQVVADALSAKVKSLPICDAFLHFEKGVGTDRTFSDMTTGKVQSWDHFHLSLPAAYVVPNKDIPTQLSEKRAIAEVFAASLEKFSIETLETVLDLIAQNTLYRGAEKKATVEQFLTVKQKYDRLPADQKANFAWVQAHTLPINVAKLKNDVIGTLLTDIQEDQISLDDALKKWDAVMAPTNYRRTTAPVTKAMIEKAKATIEELGLTPALERRYAVLEDITVQNILFGNRQAKRKLSGDVFEDMIAEQPVKAKGLERVEEVGIEDFISKILPRATSVELLLENHHKTNLVSLIAPANPSAPELFQWNNKFSWSYNGNVTDAIRERVKQAGGSVEGDLCCRLAWEYSDDLDFHMIEPDGFHIYFGNRRQKSPSGGELDLDANGVDGPRPDPAENIFYANKARMKEGVYELYVHNYSRRSDGVGFTVQIEFEGETHEIYYDKVLRSSDKITVAKIKYSKAKGFEVVESLPSTRSVQSYWGLNTQSFYPVTVAMLSPNFWDDQTIGNKHYFFMLDGCIQEGQTRGFYNEFLKAELHLHRKVMEMVGSKMKTDEAERQLSGLGFSSTARNYVTARVKGATTRLVKILF